MKFIVGAADVSSAFSEILNFSVAIFVGYVVSPPGKLPPKDNQFNSKLLSVELSVSVLPVSASGVSQVLAKISAARSSGAKGVNELES